MRHATEPPRPLADFLPDVPNGLQNVMNWMLAKDPNQRYATPDKAAQALNLFLRNTPPARRAEGPLPDYVRWLDDTGEAGTKPNPALPANIRVGRLEPTGRKPDLLRTQEPKPLVPPPPAPPPAPPAPRPAPAPSVAPFDIDVELVSVPLPAAEGDRGLLELNRRDAIMLCGGGAMVLGAILIGFGLSRALRREAPADPPPDPNAPKEG
jgi:eukaryotic-like serine/threonine-protein kinase